MMVSKNKKFGKDDDGVSPVIGVILMVAITVVMAAIVSSWSAGVKAPTSPTTVGLDIARNSQNITIVVTAIDPTSAGPIPFLNFSYQRYDCPGGNCTYFQNYTNMSNADVGQTITINANSSEVKLLVITATYKDSSKKVLYSREV